VKKVFSLLMVVVAAQMATANAAESDRMTLGNAPTPWTFPGVSAGSPVGFGANWGIAYMGVGIQAQNRTQKQLGHKGPDGNVGAGFGIGDSTKYVGLEVGIDVDSIYKNKTGTHSALRTMFSNVPSFDHGGVSLKIHRMVGTFTSVAIGRENVLEWGQPKYLVESWYAAGTHVFVLDSESEPFSALTVSAGLGTKRFQTLPNFRAGKNGVGVFGAAGLRVVKWASVIVDWTGSALNMGASFTPFGKTLFFISPTVADVAVSGGGNPGARFALSIGYAYNFL